MKVKRRAEYACLMIVLMASISMKGWDSEQDDLALAKPVDLPSLNGGVLCLEVVEELFVGTDGSAFELTIGEEAWENATRHNREGFFGGEGHVNDGFCGLVRMEANDYLRIVHERTALPLHRELRHHTEQRECEKPIEAFFCLTFVGKAPQRLGVQPACHFLLPLLFLLVDAAVVDRRRCGGAVGRLSAMAENLFGCNASEGERPRIHDGGHETLSGESPGELATSTGNVEHAEIARLFCEDGAKSVVDEAGKDGETMARLFLSEGAVLRSSSSSRQAFR